MLVSFVYLCPVEVALYSSDQGIIGSDHACLASTGALPTHASPLHTQASMVHLEVLVFGELSVLAYVMPNITKLQIFVMPPVI